VPAIEDVRHRIRHGLRQVAGASEVLRTSRSTLLAVAELARRYGGDAPVAGAHHGLGPFELRAFSQNGEDGVIAEILRRCEALEDGYFVEFGAQQGVENNCAAPDNVETLFADAGVPGEFDLLSIDVDGEDYWIWEAIEAHRPRVVVIEYNSGLEPGRRLVQPRGTGPWSGTSFVGASLAALESLGERKGYRLVHTDLTGNNAFFVRTDVPGDFPAPERVLRRGPNHWLRGEALQPDPEGRAYVDLDAAAPSP
jgi:hypothetical protein